MDVSPRFSLLLTDEGLAMVWSHSTHISYPSQRIQGNRADLRTLLPVFCFVWVCGIDRHTAGTHKISTGDRRGHCLECPRVGAVIMRVGVSWLALGDGTVRRTGLLI